MRAVLDDATAVLIDGPDRSLGIAPLHGSVQLDLLVGKAKAEGDVRHGGKCGTGVKCEETSAGCLAAEVPYPLDRVGQGVSGGFGFGWSVKSGRYPRLLSRPVIVSS